MVFSRYFRTATASLLFLLSARALAQAPRVFVVSVDGLRADMVSAERMPNLAMHAARGFHAPEAQCDLPASTVVNHATLLTGVTAQRHGILVEFALPAQIPLPTIMTHAAAAGLRCGFFATKDKLAFLANPADCDRVEIDGDSDEIVAACLGYLAEDDPDFIFLHLRDPDSAGHRDGWLSDAYFAAVGKADEHLARVIDAATENAARPTYVLVTADHGGENNSHFWNTPSVRRIPWVLLGPGVRTAADVTGVVFTADTMPTALALLGLHVPCNLDGRDMTPLLLVEAEESGPETNDTDARNDPAPSASIPCFALMFPLLLFAASRMTSGIFSSRT
ncbi:MAG: alkaline phosphatase family protein [Phycisphaerae bacterium]